MIRVRRVKSEYENLTENGKSSPSPSIHKCHKCRSPRLPIVTGPRIPYPKYTIRALSPTPPLLLSLPHLPLCRVQGSVLDLLLCVSCSRGSSSHPLSSPLPPFPSDSGPSRSALVFEAHSPGRSRLSFISDPPPGPFLRSSRLFLRFFRRRGRVGGGGRWWPILHGVPSLARPEAQMSHPLSNSSLLN